MSFKVLALLTASLLLSACKQSAQSSPEGKTTPTEQDGKKSGEVDYQPGQEPIRVIVPTDVPKITVEQAIELASQGYEFVDLRTPAEIAKGKIDGAVEMNVRSHDFMQQVADNWPLDKKVILYCHSGKRSDLAARLLAELQFTNAYDMTGGYSAWVEYHNKN